MTLVLSGARIFDGTRIIGDHAAVIEDGHIAAVVSEKDVAGDADTRRIDGLLTPGFIDVQVNGGGGVLFNDDRTVEGIATIGAAHRRYGTTGFLPTLITDTPACMKEAIAAVEAALTAKVPGLLGVHLEGPFLNPARKGVHNPDFMRPLDDADLAVLTSLKGGRTLVTLAPEMVPIDAIRRLAEAGVVVSAGHTKADYHTLMQARAAGLTGYTHLFNAMPPLAGREPGPVGAALDDAESWCGLIVDMHHVSAPSLRVAIAAKGWQRMILVTDAMSSVGSDLSAFDLHGRTIKRAGGRLTLEDGTLAGSDLEMAVAVRNAVRELGLPLEAALHMASRAPAEFLGLGDAYGRIASGYRANLALLDDDFNVVETWIDGAATAQ
jgi:N-acetylglucosamine-6-phosphate deacetylase